ncbi:MAG: NUDIX domain-containing protein [Actinomycetota bacterium]|nr:NUDIX domain-containing protein [Actinomycetota bacterium]
MPVQRFSSVVLVDGRGRVLLQERDEHPVIDPEKWGFVGGSVEEGEDYQSAAYRELEEETGVQLAEGLELFGTFEVFHEHRGGDDEFTLWVARTELADSDIVVGEGRQIVFVDPATVSTLPLTASAIVALQPFLDSRLYQELIT